eukprot:CAMPEP_0181117840 /NCGR_PEP_ID=MMETSP1071-20121207/22751_1 /TAXON_ID=35127 /ORGANISM="Thalassiosira sp., Strain NH16" /LENGTH=987 /DNA_ID=CAMNT_0023202283 /DNA_START=59 /DNA_END=3023 /DNA_ORIENTATION=-
MTQQQPRATSQSAAGAAAAACCAVCGHPGCDVLIKSCPNGCAYHARCLDVMAITAEATDPPTTSAGTDNSAADHAFATCPHCSSPAAGLEMIPLSFAEIDHAQRLSGYHNKGGKKSSHNNGSGSSLGGSSSSHPPAGKRVHADLLSSSSDPLSSHNRSSSSTSFYDPASPRTGKWSDEEIAFRDSLVPHFVDGSLPLPPGLKLIEFLSSMLKSKPSRLTKKMKHAKLSTRHFHLDAGCIRSSERAAEVSRLERAFVDCISDPVERSEIKFHMGREWRDHLAERLTYLRVPFDAEEWLRSVDAMDNRIALSKSRNRMVRRRFMMGKAMEEDAQTSHPGIFIDRSKDNDGGQDDVDLELLASALEANDHEDADLKALYSTMATDQAHAVPSTAKMTSSATEISTRSLDSGSHASSNDLAAEQQQHPPPFRSVLLPGLGSAEGPNFRFAAPFLAKVTAYIERNRVPFEHVDIWVPSSSGGFPTLDPTGATAPEPTVLGSGSGNAVPAQGGATGGRLCFAGSASVGAQILTDEDDANLTSPVGSGGHGNASPVPPCFDHRTRPGLRVVPLSSDEIYHLSLFGSYSEKFSFNPGCGLPGRVFESAVPAWEQFIANAPSHLFERRGGAIQFGIKTALGLPIKSPNVGRIVMVLYSKHNREKDDGLVARMIGDFQTLNPCPRWKLMVDMGSGNAPHRPVPERPPPPHQQQMSTGLNEKDVQISDLISLLGENMPSDQSTQLGQQTHNIMSLRLVLLRKNRDPEDEQLVDSILTLFHSYVEAGRSRPDITLMLARDFAFHLIQHQQQQQLHLQQQQQQQASLSGQPTFQRQTFIPTMQHLSIGAPVLHEQHQHQPQQHQPQELIVLDHTHHGQADGSQSLSMGMGNCSNQDFQVGAGAASPTHQASSSSGGDTGLRKSHSAMAMNNNAALPSQSASSASFSSLAERNYSNSDLVHQQTNSPRSTASLNRSEGKHPRAAAAANVVPLNEPPSSLHP